MTTLLLAFALSQTPPVASDFQVGSHVAHAANAAGMFPSGTGVVTSVTPWNTGDGFSYRVRCDATGRVLPVNFKASELVKVVAGVSANPPIAVRGPVVATYPVPMAVGYTTVRPVTTVATTRTTVRSGTEPRRLFGFRLFAWR